MTLNGRTASLRNRAAIRHCRFHDIVDGHTRPAPLRYRHRYITISAHAGARDVISCVRGPCDVCACISRQSAGMASPGMKTIVFLGTIREGRMGLRVAKFIVKQLEAANHVVELFGNDSLFSS